MGTCVFAITEAYLKAAKNWHHEARFGIADVRSISTLQRSSKQLIIPTRKGGPNNTAGRSGWLRIWILAVTSQVSWLVTLSPTSASSFRSAPAWGCRVFFYRTRHRHDLPGRAVRGPGEQRWPPRHRPGSCRALPLRGEHVFAGLNDRDARRPVQGVPAR